VLVKVVVVFGMSGYTNCLLYASWGGTCTCVGVYRPDVVHQEFILYMRVIQTHWCCCEPKQKALGQKKIVATASWVLKIRTRATSFDQVQHYDVRDQCCLQGMRTLAFTVHTDTQCQHPHASTQCWTILLRLQLCT